MRTVAICLATVFLLLMLPIKEYASLTEAAFVMGLKNNGSMSIAANSNLTKKSMGYYWQYKQ